jgi:sugar lactone lactonase YvrE
MTASLLYPANCILGEGAFWHEGRQSFFWVDIDGKQLYEYSTQTTKVNSWSFQHRPSMIALDSHGELIISFQGSVARFDLQTETLRGLIEIEKDIPDNRTNDGAIDRAGRLWLGTMNRQFKEGAGSLYCIGNDLSLTKKVEGLTIPNGLVWSLDDGTMFHIDSPSRKVQAYAFDSKTGSIAFERTAVTIPPDLGTPDGMSIDEEGMLWIAQWNGFGVYRWNPDSGKLLDKIEVPVPQVSSCAFGGANYDQLFITTAKENFSIESLKKYPDSGSVYIAQPGVRGVKKNVFRNGLLLSGQNSNV